MNNWNQLKLLLDKMFGFTNIVSSRVSKRAQGFDNKKGEHIIWLEYRVRVADSPVQAMPEHDEMPCLRELLAEIYRQTKGRE